MDPRAWIGELEFSDATVLTLSQDDVLVIVGPNNAGKSAALRGIRDKVAAADAPNPVVTKLSVSRQGSQQEVTDWLTHTARVSTDVAGRTFYHGHGTTAFHPNVVNWWAGQSGMGDLARFFCYMLGADERLKASDPAPGIALVRDPPSHPIHYLQVDDRLEAELSGQFKRAFGEDLVVHRSAGNEVPLFTGQRPTPTAGQDRCSYDYVRELETLTPLKNQGDGMRSFAGVLLYTSVGFESIILIDEPEAFLHPPQARLLGRMLVAQKRAGRQLFVATHSGDVLRGILDADSKNVRVIRIRREGKVNPACELDNAKISALWGDTLLRHSNVLDGLFHERVIVCESDSDCRFYAAVAGANFASKGSDYRIPDVMFTHGAGKDRVATILDSLVQLKVPATCVLDFDALNDESLLEKLVTTLGGAWVTLKPDWTRVKAAIDQKKPDLDANEVRHEIEQLLKEVPAGVFPDSARHEIIKVLRRGSPWQLAKSMGTSYVPNGQPSEACMRLMAELRKLGIRIVTVGELESWAKTVGGHGPAWVNAVLQQKNLATGSELEPARRFVGELFP